MLLVCKYILLNLYAPLPQAVTNLFFASMNFMVFYCFRYHRSPDEWFQILKDAVKVLHSICQHIWKTQQWPQDWKRSVFIPVQKKGNAKEFHCCTILLILHASKVMLKIIQARLQQFVNHEYPDVQVGFRKGRGTRDQITNIHWIIEKARVPEKHLFLIYWRIFYRLLWFTQSRTLE